MTADRKRAPRSAQARKEMHKDGWESVLSGFGRPGKDKSTSINFEEATLLTDRVLRNLYIGDGTAARIVNCVAEDMVRNSWRIQGDDANESLYKLGETKGVTKAVTDAIRWQRLFRGALLVKIYEGDKGLVDKPIRKGAVIQKFKVYPASSVDLNQSTWEDDEVTVFCVKKNFGGTFMVHASRCEVFKSVPLPPDADGGSKVDLTYRYWGVSEIQATYQALRNFAAFVHGIGISGQEMAVSKYRLANLNQILATKDSQALYTRMAAIEASKSMINAVLLGKDEEWERDQLSFVGLPEVFDRLAMLISGSSGVPITKLFGRSAAGLNSTGEGDSRDYYDKLNSQQAIFLGPLLSRLYSQIAPTTKDTEIFFHPVWTPSQKELIEMRAVQAKTDMLYINGSPGPLAGTAGSMGSTAGSPKVDAADPVQGDKEPKGVLTIEEVRESRFRGGYSFETVIKGGVKPNIEEGAM